LTYWGGVWGMASGPSVRVRWLAETGARGATRPTCVRLQWVGLSQTGSNQIKIHHGSQIFKSSCSEWLQLFLNLLKHLISILCFIALGWMAGWVDEVKSKKNRKEQFANVSRAGPCGWVCVALVTNKLRMRKSMIPQPSVKGSRGRVAGGVGCAKRTGWRL